MSTRKEILSNNYNPYIHRNRPGQIGNIHSLINLVKCLTGTGILAMPKAFKQSGLLIGFIFTILIVSLITYCLHIMFEGMYYLCKRDNVPYVPFPQTMKEALLVGPQCLKKFANYAPPLVNVFIIAYQFGVCCVYVVFCAKNIQMVVDDNTAPETHLRLLVYMVLFFVPLLLLTYIKDLKKLAPVSNIGNWLTLGTLFIIYYFVFEKIEAITERDLFGSASEFPLFMGTVMYSVLTFGGILSIELNMKNSANYVGLTGVLNQGMFITLILNVLTGFFGYWKYGDEIEASITLNLGKNGLAWAVQIIFVIIIVLSFPLQAYPASEIIWDHYVEKHMLQSEHKTFWDYCIRTIIVCSAYLVAIPLPFLGIIISLVGAFCLSILGVIMPPLIDICLRWSERDFGKANLYLIRDVFIIIFGISGFIFGTYAPIVAIIEEYQK